MTSPAYRVGITHTDAECTKLGWGVYKLREAPEGSNGYYMLIKAFEEETEARENLAHLLQLAQEEKPF
jgi:hypothetical protein